MPSVTFRFEGGKELAAALLQLSERGAKAVQREALADGAEVLRKAIATSAPRGTEAPHIADHVVTSRINATGEHAGGLAVGPEKGQYFYGSFLEFGTSKMSAQPFMRPGFDTTVHESLAVIRKSLWRELAAKGIGQSVSVPSVPSGPGRTV